MKKTVTFLFGLALASFAAWGGEMVVRIASHPVHAEIADTPQAREHGLMGREKLCEDCGMLFVFPVAQRYQFWMKNTPLPLDIAFIGADRRIINIAAMQPYTTTAHGAEGDALYALEMNQGWFARHHVKPGDTMDAVQPAPAAAQ